MEQLTLWMTVDEVPSRMFYAGRRWRVSDTPTRLPSSGRHTKCGDVAESVSGWRFQGTNEDGRSFVFDVYPDVRGWHVHRVYD